MNSLQKKTYNSIDLFKLLMAIAVVAIHTNPIVKWKNPIAIHIVMMIEDWAVPFFFVASGFFLWNSDEKHMSQYIKKIIRLYCVWTFLSLPLSIYGYVISGNTVVSCILSYIKYFFFVGKLYNSYHLWYLLALIYALFIIYYMRKKGCSVFTIFCCSIGIYLVSEFFLFGMDYQNKFPDGIRILVQIYQYVFNKGGIFSGFIFVALGMMIAEYRVEVNRWIVLVGTVVFVIISMFSSEYLKQWIIIPEILFLFLFVLSIRIPDSNIWVACRKISTIIYLTHLIIYSMYSFVVIKNPNKLGFDSFLFTTIVCIGIALYVIKISKENKIVKVLF